jgi:pimeloyl-ACP methyl ester carboxylesterase
MAHYGALWTDLEHNKENAKTPLAMPVLALGGEISFGDRALESARKIAKDVRGGTIPRCAHWVAEEQPAALVRELLAFFGEE